MLHGSRVEVGEGFACEAVWPDRFAGGGFDLAAIVAGSGVRVRDGEAVFVASTSTVDRLHSVERPDGPLVSNSLACLTSAIGARARLDYWRYLRDMGSIGEGLDRYRRTIPTTGPPVRLTYFNNLVWDGGRLVERDKPPVTAALASFGEYRRFMRETMAGIASNMADPGRRHPYAWLGTVSSGYDGATVTALGVEVGCKQAVTFDRSRRDEPDSGEAVARALGIEPLVIERASWYRRAIELDPLPEAPFLAAAPNGELAPFAAAREELKGRVLLTGFQGGAAWSLEGRNPGPQIVRRDSSGLGFIEFRLVAGFINCAPAFWTATRSADVEAVNRSEELRPWVVGDSYQRPFARRIVEEAGVPRTAFGQRKQPGVGGALTKEEEFLGPKSLADYRAWLRPRAATLRRRRLLATAALDWGVRGAAPLVGLAAAAVRAADGVTNRGSVRVARRRVESVESVVRPLRKGPAIRMFLFQWGARAHRGAVSDAGRDRLTVRLVTREMSGWPPLGWLATCSRRNATVRVLHGPWVEVGDGFACEAVWPASFGDGDFDRAAVVAGSGVRVRDEEVTFVSATSTVDRLHSVARSDGPVVSNSLPCLMRALGVEARLDYWRYVPDLDSVTRGLDRYCRALPTTFHNLVWAGGELTEREKSLEPTGFADFHGYLTFLRSTLTGIAENMTSSDRRRRYQFLGTLSSGYDAPAVTALSAEVGCRQAICFDESRKREPDSGVPIAHALGIEPLSVKRADWRRRASLLDALPEAPFLAAATSRRSAPRASTFAGPSRCGPGSSATTTSGRSRVESSSRRECAGTRSAIASSRGWEDRCSGSGSSSVPSRSPTTGHGSAAALWASAARGCWCSRRSIPWPAAPERSRPQRCVRERGAAPRRERSATRSCAGSSRERTWRNRSSMASRHACSRSSGQ